MKINFFLIEFLQLLGQWMDLIDDKNETELLTIVNFRIDKQKKKNQFYSFIQDKLRKLLSGICEYLEDLNERTLQNALGIDKKF